MDSQAVTGILSLGGAVVGGVLAMVSQGLATRSAKDLQKTALRPWLKLDIVNTQVIESDHVINVTLCLRAMEGRNPARFLRCWATIKPKGGGSEGGGVSFEGTVVLPGDSVLSETYPALRGEKYFDLVFKHSEPASIQVTCSYGDEKPGEFTTEETFTLKGRTYVKDSLRSRLE